LSQQLNSVFVLIADFINEIIALEDKVFSIFPPLIGL